MGVKKGADVLLLYITTLRLLNIESIRSLRFSCCSSHIKRQSRLGDIRFPAPVVPQFRAVQRSFLWNNAQEVHARTKRSIRCSSVSIKERERERERERDTSGVSGMTAVRNRFSCAGAGLAGLRRGWGGRWARAAAVAASGVVAGVLLGAACTASSRRGTAAVWCKSFNTPTPRYLIPYYLRDVRSHFRHYASVRRDGDTYMTVEDLVRALLALERDATSKTGAPLATAALHHLFEATDANRDGLVSLHEFRVLAAVLQLQEPELRTLAALVDTENRGSLSHEQLAAVLYGSTEDRVLYETVLRPNGLLSHLFGPDDRCTVEDVLQLQRHVEEQLWAADFARFAGDAATLSASGFAQLLASHVAGTGMHPPHYLEAAVHRLRGAGEGEGLHLGGVPLPAWMAFNRVIKSAEELSKVFALYHATGQPVRRENLERVLSAAGVEEALPPATADMLFAVFDKNGDGEIDLEECLRIVGLSRRIYYRPPGADREEEPLLRRWGRCSFAMVDQWRQLLEEANSVPCVHVFALTTIHWEDSSLSRWGGGTAQTAGCFYICGCMAVLSAAVPRTLPTATSRDVLVHLHLVRTPEQKKRLRFNGNEELIEFVLPCCFRFTKLLLLKPY
eukprot:gene2154-1323_t